MNKVTYTLFQGPKKGKKHSTKFSCVACFSSLKYESHRRHVVYYCKPYYTVTKAEQNFYIKFLAEVFDKTQYTVRPSRKNGIVIFKLKFQNVTEDADDRDKSHYTTLCYLTAFRYLDEFSSIVKEFYRRCKGMDIDEQFKGFLAIHKEAEEEGKWDSYNLGGHGLIYYNRGYGLVESIAVLKERLKTGMPTVHSFWRK